MLDEIKIVLFVHILYLPFIRTGTLTSMTEEPDRRSNLIFSPLVH